MYRIDGTGNATVVGRNVKGGAAFGPDGALYINEWINNRILRISRAASIPTVSEWGLAAMSLLLLAAGTLALKRRRSPQRA